MGNHRRQVQQSSERGDGGSGGHGRKESREGIEPPTGGLEASLLCQLSYHDSAEITSLSLAGVITRSPSPQAPENGGIKKADRSHRTVKCKKIGPLEFSRAYLRLFARRLRQAHLALFLGQHVAIGSRRSPLKP